MISHLQVMDPVTETFMEPDSLLPELLSGWSKSRIGYIGQKLFIRRPHDVISYFDEQVELSGGNSNYCNAVYARDSLVNVHHWVITDDGSFCGNKWTGQFSSDWSDPYNWNNTDLEAEDEEDPTQGRDVRIPMLNGGRPYPIITGDAECKTIELQTGSELRIQAGRLDVSEL